MTPITKHSSLSTNTTTEPQDLASAQESALTQPPFLSVVVPAYNEERRLAHSLLQLQQYFNMQSYPTEVIVVDDGSDDRTAAIVETFMQNYPALRLIRAAHGGKGHACKQGVIASRGRWIFICDSDLSMPITEFAKFEPLLHNEQAIIIASREAPGAQRFGEPAYRHLMGRVFNGLVRMLAVHNIQDTQCGFKCFRADIAHDIFSVQTINGWGFDVELLYVAQQRGYPITEVPIHWHYHGNSKVNPVRDTFRMFHEVWQVRLNSWRGCYDPLARPADAAGNRQSELP